MEGGVGEGGEGQRGETLTTTAPLLLMSRAIHASSAWGGRGIGARVE